MFALMIMALAMILSRWNELTYFEACFYILIGSLAGYMTNEIAVTLLTWPIKPMFGGKFQGLFYSRKEEFGANLIDSASTHLLNPAFFEDLIPEKQTKISIQESIIGMVDSIKDIKIPNLHAGLKYISPNKTKQEYFIDKLSAELGNQISTGLIALLQNEETLSTIFTNASSFNICLNDIVGKKHVHR
jgi:uncharacterized membrane protein YheB (UPF0754 family)